jgi:hypothetical protein
VAVVLLLLICYTAVQLGETWLLAETFYPNIIGPGSKYVATLESLCNAGIMTLCYYYIKLALCY